MPQQINVDLGQILEIAMLGVRRAAMFIGFGVNSADDPKAVDYRLRGFIRVNILPDNLSVESIAEGKLHFRQWILGNGLTELLHNYSLFLDEVYAVSLMIAAVGNAELSDSWERRVATFRAKTSIASKLRTIFNEAGLESHFRGHFYGFTRARNALIHANGRVLPEHCDEGQERLSVAWPGHHVFVRCPDGREVELQPGLVVSQNAEVIWRMQDRERVFALGESVRFEPRDIAEICWMVQRDAGELVNGVASIGQMAGIPTTAPPSPETLT